MDTREAFEAWCLKDDPSADITRLNTNSYQCGWTASQWQGWQAALNQPQPTADQYKQQVLGQATVTITRQEYESLKQPSLPQGMTEDDRLKVENAICWFEKLAEEYTGMGVSSAQMQPPILRRALSALPGNSVKGEWLPIPEDEATMALMIASERRTIGDLYAPILPQEEARWFLKNLKRRGYTVVKLRKPPRIHRHSERRIVMKYETPEEYARRMIEDMDAMQAHWNAGWRHKRRWIIVEEGDGTYSIHEHSTDGVAPPTIKTNKREVAARLLQLLGIGPVAPQDYPESICIGEVTYKPAEVLNMPAKGEE